MCGSNLTMFIRLLCTCTAFLLVLQAGESGLMLLSSDGHLSKPGKDALAAEPQEDASCDSKVAMQSIHVPHVPFAGSTYAFGMKALGGTNILLARDLPYVGGMLVKKALMITSLLA